MNRLLRFNPEPFETESGFGDASQVRGFKRGGFARFYPLPGPLAEAEWEQPLACPSPTRITISGYPRYQNTVASLPANEQSKLRQLAQAIVGSFRSEHNPVRIVFITGHADRDVQGGREFENRVSRDRALQTMRALKALINNEAIASRIIWKYRGVGSSQSAVPSPKTERDRRLNRRVDISPISCGGPFGKSAVFDHCDGRSCGQTVRSKLYRVRSANPNDTD